MRRPRLRALVLTAGLGTRLGPLTEGLPKPLLPVAGVPVVARTLARLAAAGCELAVLNLHHQGAALRAALGSQAWGLPLRYSEEPEILGTGGALVPPRDLLRDADAVLLVNGDTLCAWPLAALVRRHFRSGAAATLLLLRRSPDAALGGGVGVGRGGRVVQLRDAPPVGPVQSRHVFAGAHVLAPRLLEGLRDGPGDVIADVYAPLLAAGQEIAACFHRGLWHDLGTPARYLAAALDATRGGLLRRVAGWTSPLARVGSTANVRGAIVEEDAEVAEGARLDGAVVLPGARIGARSHLERSLVGPGVALPPATEIEGRMVVREPRGYRAAPGESVIAGLVYTPLDAAPAERRARGERLD